MGDRNINVRSITGLSPVQDVICDRLDLQEKITIKGKTPTTTEFLGYDPTTRKTKYMTPTDTTYTAGTGLTLNNTTFNFTGGDLGSVNVTIRGDLSLTSQFISSGAIYFSNLPTTNPSDPGRVWNDNGTLKIS